MTYTELQRLRGICFQAMLNAKTDADLTRAVDNLNQVYVALKRVSKLEGKKYAHDKMTVAKAKSFASYYQE